MKLFYALIFFFALCFNAEAVTRYASPAGGGSTPCTNSSTPCTLAIALGQVVGGVDTLILKDGTYNEILGGVSGLPIPSGSAGSPTIIRAENQRKAIIAPTSTHPLSGIILWVHNRNYITFDGIVVSGNNTFSGSSNIIQIGTSGGPYVTGISFINGECTRSQTTSCISVSGTGYLIRNNLIHDVGPNTSDAGTHGIYATLPGLNGVIDGNTVYNTFAAPGSSSLGIQVYHGQCSNPVNCDGGLSQDNITVSNNIVHDTQAAGIVTSGGANHKVFNNQVYNAGAQGIGIYNDSVSGTTNATVYNNTMYNNALCGGIASGSPSGTTTFKNNLCLSNGDNTISNFGSGALTGTCGNNGNICSTNTALVTNAAGGNFTPVVGSSLIDAGTSFITASISIPTCGTPPGCYFGANPDVGAIETGFGPTTTVTITSPASPYSTSTPSVNLSGTSINASSISWSCPRCGMSGGASGIASWTITGVILRPGLNYITVQADPGAVTASLPATYAPSFPGNTMAGAWGFEETSGLAVDSSGNSNSGTLVNGATRTIVNGHSKQGVTLSAASSQYVLVNSNISLDYTQSFTMSAWVKPATVPTDWQAIITKNYNMMLASASFGICGGGVPLVWFQANGGFFGVGDNYYACYPKPLPTGNWSHIAGKYDGTNLIFYLDGVQVAITPVSPRAYIAPTTLSLMIGASSDGASTFAYFDGDVDEVRTYNWGIPLTVASNTVPGAACVFGNPLNTAEQSIIRDMNCSVIAPVPPMTIKIPASATGLKIGSAASGLKFGAKP